MLNMKTWCTPDRAWFQKLMAFDQFAVSKSTVCRIILLPYFVLSGISLLIYVSEYINVGVLKNIEGYPWGCKCFDGMENYASPEVYASSMISGALTDALVMGVLIVFFIKKRSLYPLIFLIPYTVISLTLSLIGPFFQGPYVPPAYIHNTSSSTTYQIATPTPVRIGRSVNSTLSSDPLPGEEPPTP